MKSVAAAVSRAALAKKDARVAKAASVPARTAAAAKAAAVAVAAVEPARLDRAVVARVAPALRVKEAAAVVVASPISSKCFTKWEGAQRLPIFFLACCPIGVLKIGI